MVQQLCPGSRYAQLAKHYLDHLNHKQAGRAPEPVLPTPSPLPVSDYLKMRNAPEFNGYFQAIWDELDIHNVQ